MQGLARSAQLAHIAAALRSISKGERHALEVLAAGPKAALPLPAASEAAPVLQAKEVEELQPAAQRVDESAAEVPADSAAKVAAEPLGQADEIVEQPQGLGDSRALCDLQYISMCVELTCHLFWMLTHELHLVAK